ncbi:MAG TPA: DUF1801 domain-containing protein [Candidatus Dormibacteraeota bacterium]|nr:DUF1801 domain-containing protein [Candidatus Dormibacteraeota bacterium]
MKATKTPKRTTVVAKASKGKGFTDSEKGAMQERVKELQSGKAEGEDAVLEKIAEMQPSDRAMAKRIHAVVMASAPGLTSRLWYGMPAYAKDGKTLCFFQDARKFKTRYATFGFNDVAHLDEGGIWPVAYAVKEMTPAVEAKIGALIKKAVS